MTTLVWFRQDLRLKDNPALHAAAKRNGAVIDPEGTYVRKWVPELAKAPVKNIHAPRENAIVDLAESREAALDAYKAMRTP